MSITEIDLIPVCWERNYLTEAHEHYERVAVPMRTLSDFGWRDFNYMTRTEWRAQLAVTRPASLSIITGLT